MAIKSDRWIRQMAQEHGMIEPFEEGQVGDGVISYGLSSYGYDMRVADEFRIFHNALSPVVDPKEFDERSFVEYSGEACIIPPNSFALARSVEYFRIPRDVMTLTVGKSTYARCFSGDTRVALADGTAPTLEKMAKRADEGEAFWGYSVGRHGRIIVTLLDAPRYIGRDALLELELDNGKSIRCTPDHEFIRRDGRLDQAADLRSGDALMPLYRDLFRGYEMVYQPINGHLYPTHRLADEWNLRNGIYEDEADTHRHHIDHDRRNNMPWNIGRMSASDHIRHHNVETFGDDFDPEEHGESIRHALDRRKQDPEWRERYSRLQQERAEAFWREDIDAVSVRAALDASGSIRGAARLLDCDRSVFRRFSGVMADFRGQSDASNESRAKNHTVESIQTVPGQHDVYCLTVPEAGNFALASGVFVRNCGIITNVTPFEPEWEGYVTLEISNTTPLPAKVYSNEGIAQVLFFQADEACEVSYADRKGKYQGQTGVTTPRL